MSREAGEEGRFPCCVPLEGLLNPRGQNTHALIKRILLSSRGQKALQLLQPRYPVVSMSDKSAFHFGGPSTVSPTAQAAAHCHPGRPQSPFPITGSLAGPCPTPSSPFLLTPRTWAGIVRVLSKPQRQCTKNKNRWSLTLPLLTAQCSKALRFSCPFFP